MFNVTGQQGNIPCTASGTNTITLTPNTNYYLPAAYTTAQLASFVAVATSTGNVTIQIGSLTLVNLYNPAGTQVGSGGLVLNTHYVVQYWPDLNSGAGGFIILNSTVTSVAQPLQGTFKNLVLTNTTSTTPATQVTPTADQLILQNASGGSVTITNYAPPVTSTQTTGANGLDTGSVADNTWYYFYAIYNAATTTAAGLLSKSATAPTLPSGYTYFARLGAFLTDASGNLYYIIQKGRRSQYVIGTDPANALIIVHATSGTMSATSPTLATASVAGLVPVTASELYLGVSNAYANNGIASYSVAPNTAWGGTNNGYNGTNGNIYPFAMNGLAGNINNISGMMLLEATTIATAGGTAGFGVAALGWIDNI